MQVLLRGGRRWRFLRRLRSLALPGKRRRRSHTPGRLDPQLPRGLPLVKLVQDGRDLAACRGRSATRDASPEQAGGATFKKRLVGPRTLLCRSRRPYSLTPSAGQPARRLPFTCGRRPRTARSEGKPRQHLERSKMLQEACVVNAENEWGVKGRRLHTTRWVFESEERAGSATRGRRASSRTKALLARERSGVAGEAGSCSGALFLHTDGVLPKP